MEEIFGPPKSNEKSKRLGPLVDIKKMIRPDVATLTNLKTKTWIKSK